MSKLLIESLESRASRICSVRLVIVTGNFKAKLLSFNLKKMVEPLRFQFEILKAQIYKKFQFGIRWIQ